MIARIRRAIADRRYRRWHQAQEPSASFRLMVLNDDPYPTYTGVRAWCDGRLKPCFCGRRCCDCHHREVTTRA